MALARVVQVDWWRSKYTGGGAIGGGLTGGVAAH